MFEKLDRGDKELRGIGPRNRQRRRQQAGAGLDLSKAIDLGKKATGSKLSKMMINEAITIFQGPLKKLKNKITNKKVKAVMDTGVDDYLVNREVV